MSIRLQVLLDPSELRDIRRVAKSSHQTVSEWVRQALRAARTAYPEREVSRKLHVLREAARHGYPSGDIRDMLKEIEDGYSDRKGA
jgi:hypothetical protein